MPHASLDSTELLKDLRVALIQFAEESRVALGEAESEINRTVQFIQQAEPHWKGVIRDLQEKLAQGKEQLRQKMLYPTAGGGRQSVVDEKKQVAALQRKLEEAEAKLRNVQRWKREVEVEAMQYRGLVQPIGRFAEYEAPRAVALLDRMADALDQYLTVAAPAAGGAPGGDATEESMRRAVTEQPEPPQGPDGTAPPNEPQTPQEGEP